MKKILCSLLLLYPSILLAGVSIHFSGEVASTDDAKKIVTLSKNYVEEKKWKYSKSKYGLIINPHKEAESLFIEFTGKKLEECSIKTQFAGAELHRDIIKLLKKIKPFMSKFEVIDEGEYWETGDFARLKKNIGETGSIIEQMR